MAKFFEPVDLSISGLFKDGDPIYKIPNYQRPYSWEDEQVYALWDDIYEAYTGFCEEPEKSQNYFLGSVIVVSSKTQPKVFDVVDRSKTASLQDERQTALDRKNRVRD